MKLCKLESSFADLHALIWGYCQQSLRTQNKLLRLMCNRSRLDYVRINALMEDQLTWIDFYISV